jgi:hypothetical protein
MEPNVHSLFLPLTNTQYEQLGLLMAHASALRRLVKIPHIESICTTCKPMNKQKMCYTIP